MARVDGIPQVIAALKKHGVDMVGSTRPRVDVLVGYSADYALPVHERVDIPHRPPTQAKYLETPFKRRGRKYGRIVERRLRAGVNLALSLLTAGLALQGDSQRICPVRTGHLRNSAFTEIER